MKRGDGAEQRCLAAPCLLQGAEGEKSEKLVVLVRCKDLGAGGENDDLLLLEIRGKRCCCSLTAGIRGDADGYDCCYLGGFSFRGRREENRSRRMKEQKW